MILDEAQNIKNAETLRWQGLVAIKARSKVLVTGTPVQNIIDEL